MAKTWYPDGQDDALHTARGHLRDAAGMVGDLTLAQIMGDYRPAVAARRAQFAIRLLSLSKEMDLLS
jgi:hypothetical protein